MPASKWLLNYLNRLQPNSFEVDNNLKEELLADISFDPIPESENQSAHEIENSVDLIQQIPEEISILPLRGLVVFPQTGVPLTIGQSRSFG
jgi:ATP-dependent Lon protease